MVETLQIYKFGSVQEAMSSAPARSGRQASAGAVARFGVARRIETVNCAATKEEEINQEEDEDILEAATLNYMLVDRSHGQYQVKEDRKAGRSLKGVGELRRGERARGLGLGKGTREKIDKRR